MNIGQVADLSGLPPRTIRYYEQIGLMTADRGVNGYRDFTQAHLEKLRFLARARSLGFTIEDCRALLALYEDPHRASADVKAVAQQHLRHIDRKIGELKGMREVLTTLVDRCRGNDRPECPILQDLTAGGERPET